MSAGASEAPVLIRPAWIRARAPQGPGYERLLGLMRGLDLHTVCEEAHCPNLGECWSRGTATFMILGDVCTRACGFCAVKTGLPETPPDPAEARRVAEAVDLPALAPGEYFLEIDEERIHFQVVAAPPTSKLVDLSAQAP